jgi:hypothetical protein
MFVIFFFSEEVVPMVPA